jgi:predicted ATPase/DNA-binding XRE family transcriptional regulator
MQNTSIGAWLKRRRAELALTQQQLGQRVGASVATIRKLEADARKPSLEMTRALLRALAISEAERAAFLALATAASDERQQSPTGNPNRWPSTFTPLVGREAALSRATDFLRREDTRLLTVLGPGGMGKTRLALAVAQQATAQFADGVFFVDLASVLDAAQVPDAIYQAVAAPRGPSASAQDALLRTLKNKHALLILDNFEQVAEAAHGIGALLLACPRLKVLVTSRSALRMGLEKRFTLEPLAVPDAMDLFTQRAQEAHEGFALNATNTEAVRDLCQLLEGSPLAIELVAARISLMSPSELLRRLKTRDGKVQLDLVADGLSPLPPRQKTLRQTLQWSYDLLSADEQAALRWLSVFANGFTLASAEVLLHSQAKSDSASDYSGPIKTWNLLTSLLDKSLIQKREPRMLLLETVRQFASEKLTLHNEATDARARHTHLFLQLAEEAAQGWVGPQQQTWANALQIEQADLHAALENALSVSDAVTSVRFCAGLWRFWLLRGQLHAGRRYCERALALASNTKAVTELDHAKLLGGLGWLCERQGDYAEAKTHWRESLRIYQQVGDRVKEASLRSGLGIIALDERDFAQAELIFTETVAFCKQEGLATGLASSYSNLAVAANAQGQFAKAIGYYSQAITIWRELGSQADLAWCLAKLGFSQVAVNDIDAGRTTNLECLILCEALDDALNTLDALEGMAMIAAKRGQDAMAVQLLAVVTKHSADLGAEVSPDKPDERNSRADFLNTLRQQMGDERFDVNWRRGNALSLQAARALASTDGERISG